MLAQLASQARATADVKAAAALRDRVALEQRPCVVTVRERHEPARNRTLELARDLWQFVGDEHELGVGHGGERVANRE